VTLQVSALTGGRLGERKPAIHNHPLRVSKMLRQLVARYQRRKHHRLSNSI
jgi:hypothetical protein